MHASARRASTEQADLPRVTSRIAAGFVTPVDPPRLDRQARQTPEHQKKGPRSEGQRDRDRVLYASAFRRLGGVTQVVMALDEGHVFHNRLTHSLKVSQAARRIAEKILWESQGRARAETVMRRAGGLAQTRWRRRPSRTTSVIRRSAISGSRSLTA